MAHPIIGVLVEQGRSQAWLARKIGRTHEHTNRVLNGVHTATPEFRAACARLLDLPESVLFHGAAPREPAPSEDVRGTGSDRPRLHRGPEHPTDAPQEVAIGIPA